MIAYNDVDDNRPGEIDLLKGSARDPLIREQIANSERAQRSHLGHFKVAKSTVFGGCR